MRQASGCKSTGQSNIFFNLKNACTLMIRVGGGGAFLDKNLLQVASQQQSQ